MKSTYKKPPGKQLRIISVNIFEKYKKKTDVITKSNYEDSLADSDDQNDNEESFQPLTERDIDLESDERNDET